MLIKPAKRSEKTYTIISIKDSVVTLKNDYQDEKEIEIYEFDLQNIIPEIGKFINLIKYDQQGCSVFEEYDKNA